MVTISKLRSTMKREGGWIAAAVASVMMLATPASASTITYYHNDLAGSPVAATNSSAQMIWRESYRPYGERLTKSAASKPNDVWFTSRRQDSTGLVYMGARYYDPVSGRFVSTDSKQFDETNLQSFNRYEYANDNPYKYVDPDGKWATILVRAEYSVVFAVATQLGARTLGLAIGAGIYDWIHNEQADEPGKSGDKGATSTDGGQGKAHFPDRPLPRDEHGRPVPDPEAEGAYSQLGQRSGRSGKYDQAREFDAEGKSVRDIDFTDHGRPSVHENPHQHPYRPNATGGTPQRGDSEPLP